MIVVGYPNANFDDFVKIKHIDNTYLEILIRYGLFGFLLFISPLIQNLKKFKILIFHRNCSYEIRFAKSVIFAILVQGLYETNMPSLGNLMNIMLFFSFGLLNDPTNSRKLVKSSQIL
jgi:O-antigen ligase